MHGPLRAPQHVETFLQRVFPCDLLGRPTCMIIIILSTSFRLHFSTCSDRAACSPHEKSGEKMADGGTHDRAWRTCRAMKMQGLRGRSASEPGFHLFHPAASSRGQKRRKKQCRDYACGPETCTVSIQSPSSLVSTSPLTDSSAIRCAWRGQSLGVGWDRLDAARSGGTFHIFGRFIQKYAFHDSLIVGATHVLSVCFYSFLARSAAGK